MAVTNKDVIVAINDIKATVTKEIGDSKEVFAAAIKATEDVAMVRFDGIDKELERIGSVMDNNSDRIGGHDTAIATIGSHWKADIAHTGQQDNRLDGLEGRERTANYKQGGIAALVSLVVAWVKEDLPSLLQ